MKEKEFVCLTQVSDMASFTGPSGTSYHSKKGFPIRVFNELDVEFFSKNKRFGLFSKNKGLVEPVKSADLVLKDKLVELKISGPGISKIIKVYEDFAQFMSDVQSGTDIVLQLGLSKKDADVINGLL